MDEAKRERRKEACRLFHAPGRSNATASGRQSVTDEALAQPPTGIEAPQQTDSEVCVTPDDEKDTVRQHTSTRRDEPGRMSACFDTRRLTASVINNEDIVMRWSSQICTRLHKELERSRARGRTNAQQQVGDVGGTAASAGLDSSRRCGVCCATLLSHSEAVRLPENEQAAVARGSTPHMRGRVMSSDYCNLIMIDSQLPVFAPTRRAINQLYKACKTNRHGMNGVQLQSHYARVMLHPPPTPPPLASSFSHLSFRADLPLLTSFSSLCSFAVGIAAVE